MKKESQDFDKEGRDLNILLAITLGFVLLSIVFLITV